MTDGEWLREFLLDEGMEDSIPLAEAVGLPEITARFATEIQVEAISTALIHLLHEGRILVLVGRWDSVEFPVSEERAEGLLRDRLRYFYDSDTDGHERVYFLNKANYRD
jgi:hypothetical protein